MRLSASSNGTGSPGIGFFGLGEVMKRDELAHRVGLTEAHLCAIGHACVRWAEIENTISEIIWSIADLGHMHGLAITTHLSERSRIDICNAITETTIGKSHPDLTKKLKDLLTFIEGNLYPQRNSVVHSRWGIAPTAGKSEILPIKARGKLTIGPRKEYSAQEIEDIAEKISDAADDLERIRIEIWHLLPTLRNWPQSSRGK